eukprot:m.129408 g.129408  ORF g.129408 m.129408 type:complete len:885 (-) comp11261_c1_seq1:829-3483(-)
MSVATSVGGLPLCDITLSDSEQVLVDVDAAYGGVPGRVSLTSRRLLFRPLEQSDTVKLYNKLRAEIVSNLGEVEHVAVTNFEVAQSVILTLSDGSEHAINFDNGPESRPSRDRLRTAIQRALSSAATIATDDNMRQQRRSSALSSPASTFDPSELNADMTGGGPDAIDACEMSRKITTTGIHLGQRVMLVDTSQYDHQRGTLRYIGPVHFQLGETCGIELDIPGGSNSGRFGDIRYFYCPAMHGAFVPVRCVAHEPEKAAEDRANMPVVPPLSHDRRKLLLERPTWDADDKGPECTVCGRSFSFSRRRHHCRSCGTLCCDSCSSTRMAINYFAYFEEERVCDDCSLFVPTFSTASAIVLRAGNKVGLDKSEEGQAAQIAAIDEIIAMLSGAGDTLLMARCGVVKLLMMLAMLPVEQVKRRALLGLWKVAEFAQLHNAFVAKGGLTILMDNLKTETHPEILINAVSAMALICENTKFRYPAAQAGAVQILLLHAMQPFIRMQLIATEAIATLCQEPQVQDFVCDAPGGEILFKMLALVVALSDARCQEHMFCALAHMTTQERHVEKVAEANLRIGDVFKQLSSRLLADERTDTADKSAREHSLVHLACILANLGCIVEPVQGSACRALCDLSRLHNSTHLQDHVSRGLANFSRLESCALDILRVLRHIAVPLQTSNVSNFWAQSSSLCTIFNILTLRQKETLKHLKSVSNFGAVLIELARHTNAAPVVKSLAYKIISLLGKASTTIDPNALPRLKTEIDVLNLPQVTADSTSLFPFEMAVPTLFRFGDKRTYLEQVALEQAVRSSLRKKQFRTTRILDQLDGIATERTERLADFDKISDNLDHDRTKEVLGRVRALIASRTDQLKAQVTLLRTDLLQESVEVTDD